MIMALLTIAAVSAGDTNETVMTSTDDSPNELSQANEKEIINQKTMDGETGAELLGADEATYTELKSQIGNGGDINITKKRYTYTTGDGNTIKINTSGVINGNGAIIDMKGSNMRAFYVTVSGVTIKNLTIQNANYYGHGSAIYFINQGTVENCNFTCNNATSNGGAIWMYSGTVSNCNFTNNTAIGGGAIYFNGQGTVENCNFTCNNANAEGGAIWIFTGSVANCNFASNSAEKGANIYSLSSGSTADTCIFKTEPNNYNVLILAPTLNVDNSTIYKSNETLTFDLRTNSSIPVANGIISIRVYHKNNNSWIANYTSSSGKGWIIDLPEGSYYAIFNTEYEGFTPVNKSIKVIKNIEYYANVTPISSNNLSVNITAKSNIPQDIVGGKLLFIVPNTDPINATYAGNGTWWALHEFNDAGDYNITALYTGLDNVTINNSTISIRFDTSLDVNNKTLDLLIGDQFTIVVTTTPDGLNVSYVADDSGVYSIDENGNVVALKEGKGVISIKVGGDGKYVESSTMVNVTVSKVPTEITLANDTLVLAISDTIDTGITLTPPNAGNVTYFISNSSVVKVEDGKIIALAEGKSTITVSFEGDKKYLAAENKTINVVVNRIKTELAANTITTTYNINKDLVITLKDSNGKALSGVKVSVDLNGAKIYTTDSNGQVKVSTNSLAPKTYTAKITFNGNTIYDKSAKDVKVTVKKATPKITAKKKTFKTSVKTKKYTITLKDNTGKPIKNAKVTLKVKGKTYKAKTNSKGKATFKITKLNKKGNYKATVTYKANKYYNKATKKVKIKVIITFKTVSKGSKDKSTVKEIQQALKDKGYYLSYKGHYLKVDGKFNSCTVRSIKEFQHDKGLKVTGNVDEKTAKKLGII